LDPSDKLVLQVASVVGETFPSADVAALLDVREEEIQISLRRLHEKEMLYEAAMFPATEYRFGHALIRDVAYGALPIGERRKMHSELVTILEGSDDAGLERLAYHAFRGEQWEKAARYSTAAGEKSIRTSAYREASTFFHQAVHALAQLPRTTEIVKSSIDARLQLRVAETGARGALFKIQADLDEAAHLAESIGDDVRRGRVAIHAGYTANMLGDALVAERHAETAFSGGSTSEDHYLIVESRILLAQSHVYSGKLHLAIPLLEPHMDFLLNDIRYATMDQTMIRSVVACAHYAVAEAGSGKLEEAMRWIDEGISISDEAGRPFDRMYMQFALGKSLDLVGDPTALGAHESAVEIADENDLWFMKTFAQPWHGHALVRAGRPEHAIKLLRETEAEARLYELPFVEVESRAFASVVMAALSQDPSPDAIAAIEFGNRHSVPELVMLGSIALGETEAATLLADEHGFTVWAQEMRDGLWAW
ncbi:MAG: hypothetical protein WBM90_06790, partial [Acidimicrobiia bacterium]